MPLTPSIMGLHLRYRIWIAEMNADITILRIFDDYLSELVAEKDKTGLKTTVDSFQKQFAGFRKEMDELKHEMHLQKMKLAAYARTGQALDKKLYKDDNHAALKKRYADFKKLFNKMKSDFGLIKSNWLD